MALGEKKWYQKWWGIILLLVFTFFLILVAAYGFYIYALSKKITNNQLIAPAPYQGQIKSRLEGGKNYWLGAGNPKITIVEFADFACPFCKNSYPKIREISLKYKNDVKIIFRDFPYLTEHSIELAQAARCAGEQGLFWPMHDKLYQNQGVSAAAELTELANQVGADLNRFNSCLSQKKYLTDIQNDLADAEKLNVEGTPTWFVNGYKIAGDLPLSAWEEILGQFSK